MLIMENIRLALMSLKANKMRALLTMLGIIIGISSVIGIMTVGDSLTEKVNSSLGGMGLSTLSVGLNLRKDENGNYP
ncbi:MAG: ABC transporter permease, partial [Lachnospiraceae bacterium]|nr:ABC transporter permease [Lachnospiraceae bacterium]